MTRLRSTVAHHVRRIHHQERSPSSWNSKEHTSDKNEDAITSMVFTPLRFMAPGEALKCLRAVVPSIAEVALARGSPIDQNVTLWPPGLKARGWGGPGQTRVEPDLVAEFTFPTSGS